MRELTFLKNTVYNIVNKSMIIYFLTKVLIIHKHITKKKKCFILIISISNIKKLNPLPFIKKSYLDTPFLTVL